MNNSEADSIEKEAYDLTEACKNHLGNVRAMNIELGRRRDVIQQQENAIGHLKAANETLRESHRFVQERRTAEQHGHDELVLNNTMRGARMQILWGYIHDAGCEDNLSDGMRDWFDQDGVPVWEKLDHPDPEEQARIEEEEEREAVYELEETLRAAYFDLINKNGSFTYDKGPPGLRFMVALDGLIFTAQTPEGLVEKMVTNTMNKLEEVKDA